MYSDALDLFIAAKFSALNIVDAPQPSFKTLVENIVPTSLANTCQAGGICCSSKQLVVGNPLYQIPFDELGCQAKPLKCNQPTNSIKHNQAERFLALTSDFLSIFDLDKQSTVREFHEHNGAVTDVTWHRTSNFCLATVGTDCTLRMWDVRSHPAQVSMRRVQRPFRCLQYSPDCSFIACAGESITIFDLNSAQALVQIPCGSPVSLVSFNPTECLLATASEDRLVRFWDVDTAECVTQSLPFDSIIYRMEFHPEGKYLIVATASYISCVTWEPFEILSQIKRPDDCSSAILDVAIHDAEFFQLTTESAGDGLSSVTLISIPLMDLENRISALHTEPQAYGPRTPLSPPLVGQITPSATTSPFVGGGQQRSIAQLPPLIQPFGRPRPDRISSSTAALHSFPTSTKDCCLTSPESADSDERSSLAGDEPEEDLMVYLPSSSSTASSSAAATNPRSSLSNISSAIPLNNEPIMKLVKKPVTLKSPPPSTHAAIKLKQSRSKSCSTKSLTNNAINRVVKNTQAPNNAASPMTRRGSTTKGETNAVKRGDNGDFDEIANLNALIKGSAKIRATVKRRKAEVTKLLNHPSLHTTANSRCDGLAAIETMVDEIVRQEDAAHLLAMLFKSYLLRPKCYSLGVNAILLDKIRLLFSHANIEYPALALELLEMVVQSFGESIKHGLKAKSFNNIGVDVSAEERFERCTKCRKGLMQVQLSASFLSDRLKPGTKQETAFKQVLAKIDRILED